MRLFGRKKTKEAPEVIDVAPTLPPGPEVNDLGLRTVTDHRNYLLSLVEPLPPFGMHLVDAMGLALCEQITAHHPLPRTAVAADSGYAVVADELSADGFDDGRVELAVVTKHADDADELSQGEAAWVDAGQVLPVGASAVVGLDQIEHGDDTVILSDPVRVGDNVHQAGSDVAVGDVLGQSGQVLDPRTAGLLAGMGIDKVLARPRPRIVVLSAGKGLVDPGKSLPGPGFMHDADSYLIAAAAKAEGCQVWRVGVVADDIEELREQITDQLIRADMVVSCGGFKAGDGSLLSKVIPELGLVDYAEVAMHPGGSQGFALLGEDKIPMVMLPGEPVGAYVSFQAFVRPLIRRLMGAEQTDRPTTRAITRSMIRSEPGVAEFVRGNVMHDRHATFAELLPGREVERLSDLARSNALILLDEQTELVQAGTTVNCWVLDD